MERHLEKTTEENNIPLLFLLKSLLFSYILTAILLLILAFVLYKAGITEKTVSIAIIGIYVVSTFFAGFLTGKRMKNRKFIWGLLMGIAYFLILVTVSFFVNHSLGELGNHFFTTMILCAGGGMLGGMLG